MVNLVKMLLFHTEFLNFQQAFEEFKAKMKLREAITTIKFMRGKAMKSERDGIFMYLINVSNCH